MENSPSQFHTTESPETGRSPGEAPFPSEDPSGRGHQRPTVDLFGMAFIAAEDEHAVVQDILDWKPCEHTPSLLVTPNVDIVVRLHDPDMRELAAQFKRADFVLPDGWPIVRAAKMARRPLPARLAGSTVFAEWWPSVARSGRAVAIAVSSQQIADKLSAEHERASVMVAPLIEATPDGAGLVAAELVDRAIEVDADYVVVGIGFPKDGLVAAEFIRQWPDDRPAPLFMCLGASAEMYLGLRRRAPVWAQKAGLEWLHRFVLEPRRMFRRYFVRDPKFIPIAFREIRGRT